MSSNFQSLTKTPVKFQKDWDKNVEGVGLGLTRYLVWKMFLPRAEDVQISDVFVSRCFCQRPKKCMTIVYNPQINFFIHASIVSVLGNLRYK